MLLLLNGLHHAIIMHQRVFAISRSCIDRFGEELGKYRNAVHQQISTLASTTGRSASQGDLTYWHLARAFMANIPPQHLACLHQRDVGVRSSNHGVWNNVLGLLEPPRAGLVQDLALEWHRCQKAVKGALAVRGDNHNFIVQDVRISNFPLSSNAHLRTRDTNLKVCQHDQRH